MSTFPKMTLTGSNQEHDFDMTIVVVPKTLSEHPTMVARVMYNTGGQYCMCCIGEEKAKLVESVAIFLGATSIVWEWPKNGDNYMHRWEHRIPHEIVEEVDPDNNFFAEGVVKGDF